MSLEPLVQEDPEAIRLRDVYQPDAVNLTVRGVVVGMLIGVVMCVSNLYVFFKTGWSIGVTVTAAILAWGVFKALGAAGLSRTPLGPLENNALTTVASGAGYMTGGGNMAAVAPPVPEGRRRLHRTHRLGLHRGREPHGRGGHHADQDRRCLTRTLIVIKSV